jgi:hypothetical protein
VTELEPAKNVVLQQMERNDMPNEHPSDKPPVTERKPPGNKRLPSRDQPELGSPLANDGPELIRDSHC